MGEKSSIKYCLFCGHWINETVEKCNNCGEFLDLKSKRSLCHLIPNWVSVLATVVIAGVAILGVVKVKEILHQERVKAIENHLTWIEVAPVEFLSTGKKDPADDSSTFWYLEIQVQNLGKKTAYVHLKDWSFESNKRGKITNEAYTPKEIKFSLPSGNKANWGFSFVMNSDFHIPPIMSGKDRLVIKSKFDSKDMANKEKCEYGATWIYTKGKFLLLEDNRHYETLNMETSSYEIK